jgi:sugar lactone lactonase YvrE
VLGNILAGCVNTAGASAYCTMFLGYTPGATDTAGAAIYIAQHPASNVTNLFNLASGVGAPWLPALSVAPNDWTMSISYSVPGAGTGNYASHQVAVDAEGNIWVSGASTANQLAAVNNLGVPLSGSPFSGNGLSVPTNIAVDAASANVWVVDYTGNSLSEFTTAGATVQTVTPYSSGTTDALSSPTDVVFDNAGALWVNNYDNGSSSLVKLTSTGTFAATGSSSSYLKGGEGLASETNGSIFAVSYSSKDIALFTNADAYSAELSTTYVSNGIAIDASGNAWVANSEKYIYKVNSANTADTKITANGSTYYIPEFFGVAIDGGGNVWLPDWSNGVIEELNNSGTVVSGTYGFEPAETVSYTPSGSTAPPTGYFEPYNIAVDGSGNVWFNSKTAAGVLQEMVGAATPVVTPLAYGVKNSLLGTAP